MDAISLENVTKAYDEVKAVDGVSLRVKEGAILGLLGPTARPSDHRYGDEYSGAGRRDRSPFSGSP